MKNVYSLSPFLVGWIFLILLAGCAAPTPETPPPDTTSISGPKSCDEVEGSCIKLTFDSEFNCIYEGPEIISTRTATLIFLNESGNLAAVNMVRHTGDETIQDMIDYIGEEPTSKHHPLWSEEVGTWMLTKSGMVHIWEGELKQGIYTMVCASALYGMWFGGGFIVE